jgi:hypothetical protein
MCLALLDGLCSGSRETKREQVAMMSNKQLRKHRRCVNIGITSTLFTEGNTKNRWQRKNLANIGKKELSTQWKRLKYLDERNDCDEVCFSKQQSINRDSISRSVDQSRKP